VRKIRVSTAAIENKQKNKSNKQKSKSKEGNRNEMRMKALNESRLRPITSQQISLPDRPQSRADSKLTEL
jgi:hypothetical protein